jgi:hypothetical protein
MHDAPDSIDVRCFGQRMLSPYRGVVHSVVTRWADAVTTDGRRWTLYVRGECLYDDLADLHDRSISVPDVKYGTWSADAGFQRAPIRLPTFDDRVREEGERLLTAVQARAGDLPFPLADRFELWLLHRDSGLPLALIASSCSADDCERPPSPGWTPGQACMSEVPEARALRTVIGRLAGDAPQAQWFERRRDGSGVPQHAEGDALRPALPAERFAPLLVDDSALSEEEGRLLGALHRWQSPALLQLPTLSTAQRARFEEAARAHALRLAEQLPLYPCVLDRAAVTAALVEARLRRSLPDGTAPSGASRTLSPDYLEIPDA